MVHSNNSASTIRPPPGLGFVVDDEMIRNPVGTTTVDDNSAVIHVSTACMSTTSPSSAPISPYVLPSNAPPPPTSFATSSLSSMNYSTMTTLPPYNNDCDYHRHYQTTMDNSFSSTTTTMYPNVTVSLNHCNLNGGGNTNNHHPICYFPSLVHGNGSLEDDDDSSEEADLLAQVGGQMAVSILD